MALVRRPNPSPISLGIEGGQYVTIDSHSVLTLMKHQALRGWHPKKQAEGKCKLARAFARGLLFVLHVCDINNMAFIQDPTCIILN